MTPKSRGRLRLAMRDLSAAAAFLGIALSGSMPWWVMAAFALGLFVALSGRRPFSRHLAGPAIVLALVGAALFGMVWRGGIDLVVAACSFAALVAVQRMLAASSSATDNQVHLTSLLMISGGAALSGELTFGLCLFAFSLLASLSLGLSVIEGASPPDEAVPLSPALRSLVGGGVAAMVGAAIFFVAFPRLSWNVAARRASPVLGPAVTGLSDSVRLGGGGSIKTNPRVVLRASLQPDPAVAQLHAYWFGRAFDHFDGREWRGTSAPSEPSGVVFLQPKKGELIHQHIELLPAYDARTLVALEPPVRFFSASASFGSGSGRTPFIEVPGEEVRLADNAQHIVYRAQSEPGGATEYFGDLSRYLQLPERLDPRVGELAARVVGGERDPLAVAQRLRAHLRAEYGYTLELPGEVKDPVADFLFQRKEGHCEHFATALTLLLRTRGIPARVAAGFFGGERLGDKYVVRAGDAHAWTQVYVEGQGFVSMDATPDAYRAAQPLPLLGWLTGAYELFDAWWRARVLDYSIQDQFQLARALVRPPASSSKEEGGATPPLEAWIAAAGAALLVYGAWRVSLLRRRHVRLHPAASFADAIDRALLRAGVQRQEGEDLEALSTRLLALAHPLAEPVGRAVRRYLEARFGGARLAKTEQAALLSLIAVPTLRRAA